MTHWWEGTMLGFDLETTGVNPLRDRMVSYCLIELGAGKPPDTAYKLVNPGYPIPPAATQIHGITDEMAADGEDLDSAVGYILDRLHNASHRGVPVVGMNLNFDLTMVNAESWRRQIPSTFASTSYGCLPKPVVDLLVLDKSIDPYRLTKASGGRTLANICKHYGVAHGGAHDAKQDVLAACRAVWKIGRMTQASHVDLHKWYESRRSSYSSGYRGSTPYLHQMQTLHQIGQMTLEELHAAQTIWRFEQATHQQEYLRKEGGEPDAEVSTYWPVIPCGMEDRDLYADAT